MSDNEYKTVGLYNHNADSYNMVKAAYESGKDIVGIVHATGTGKSYNALQLAYDNRGKKIVYVVPSNGIIEHIKKIIEDNPNLNIERDFPNLEFRTYSSLLEPYKKDKIAEIECDLLILDEFHHIGAPIWGKAVNKLIETHPEAKIFGMTAYTVRDRGTSYERDMANPDTDELFSGKIESRYDLCDAMIDGVLPKPVYKSAYTNLIGLESKLEERVQKLNATSREYQEYMAILSDVKSRIHEAPSIPNILRKSIKPNGKYIYFCPPCSEEGTNDIETVKKQAIEWFREFVPEENIIIYTSTSDMGEDGKLNRDAFYDDVTLDGEKVDNKLRVMFAINQYNEGIHAPNIDGVIMGRGTTSDIVYFEQLGRALSVRCNTKEMFDKLEKYSVEELLEMCKSRDIPVKENETKEDLIEKLIAPVVIDLTNNYEFIKELENNLRDRIKDIQTNGLGNHRDVKIRDASFDIEIENQDLFETLRYVSDKLTMTWEDYYELAKAYYEHHGNLKVPENFKTINGYEFDENGMALGNWIRTQRRAYNGKRNMCLDETRTQLLKNIGIDFEMFDAELSWEEKYNLAKIYYEHYGNLEIPGKFKTSNGYEPDENGVNLGTWILGQRQAYAGKGSYKISDDRVEKLKQIGMVFDSIMDKRWMKMYKLARTYYEHHGNLEIPLRFKTSNGYEPDENGVNLGTWISNIRKRYKNNRNSLTDEKLQLLKEIGMKFENVLGEQWYKKYSLARAYYEHHGNLNIPSRFKTSNGYEPDENGMALGSWIRSQKSLFNGTKRGNISEEQIELLRKIGIDFEIFDAELSWKEKYNLAKIYYEHYGNLEIPVKFKTSNGYEPDENGVNLGTWILGQRQAYAGKGSYKISDDRVEKLKQIGMNFKNVKMTQWDNMYSLAKKYYNYYGNLDISFKFRTINGYEFDENGIALGEWVVRQRQSYNGRNNLSLTDEKINLLESIGMVFDVHARQWMDSYSLAKMYYEHHGDLRIPSSFKTINGYEFDEAGFTLGSWIYSQRKNYEKKESGKITPNQIQLLDQIGMIWNIKKNKDEIANICIINSIDQNKNKSVLKRISIQELQSKIEFLKSHNVPIVDENGLLIDIFSMSNADMKEKYGISLEEIISEYYIKNQMGKGV